MRRFHAHRSRDDVGENPLSVCRFRDSSALQPITARDSRDTSCRLSSFGPASRVVCQRARDAPAIPRAPPPPRALVRARLSPAFAHTRTNPWPPSPSPRPRSTPPPARRPSGASARGAPRKRAGRCAPRPRATRARRRRPRGAGGRGRGFQAEVLDVRSTATPRPPAPPRRRGERPSPRATSRLHHRRPAERSKAPERRACHTPSSSRSTPGPSRTTTLA